MELFGVFLMAAVVNNFVLYQFLGICPFVGVSRRVDMAVGMGLAVTFVMTMSGLITWAINTQILQKLDLDFLMLIIFIFVIAGFVQLVEMYLRRFHPPLYKSFGIYLPLITTNCAILGACILIDMTRKREGGGYDFLKTLVFCLGGGLGFTMAITIMAGIREELQLCDVPKALKGAGITLITAGILAMAFMGFLGMK